MDNLWAIKDKLLPYGQWVFDKSRVAPRSG